MEEDGKKRKQGQDYRIALLDLPDGPATPSLTKRIVHRPQPPEHITRKMLNRDVLFIAMPAFAELVLTQLTGMADQIMVGRLPGGEGVSALSAVGIASQPKFLLVTMMQALNVGATVMVARYRGQEKQWETNNVFLNCLVFNVIMSIILSVVGIVFATPMLSFMGGSGLADQTFDFARDYFLVQMAGMVPMCITVSITAVLRGIGETRTPMVYNSVANIVNVIFNYLLIYGKLGFPEMKVIGASWATVIGQTVACVIAVVYILKKDGYISFAFAKGFRLDMQEVGRIAKIGLPSMVENMILRLGLMIYTRTVALLGDVPYATHQICINIQNVSWMTGQAFQTASTTLTGQSLGKRRPDAAISYVHRTRTLSAYCGFALLLLLVFAGKPIIRLYNETPEVVELGAKLLIIIGLTQPLQADMFVYGGALRGAGDTRFQAIVAFVGVFAVRVALTYLFIYGFQTGVIGAWYALAADQFMRTLLVGIRYYNGKWRMIKLTAAEKASE